jgi:hypothetical protein
MTLRKALFLVIVAEMLIIALAIWNYGVTLPGLQAATRFSGRFSLFLFSLIFLFIHHEHLNVRMFLSENFYAVFAVAHGIHLVELITYVSLSGNELIPIRVAGGALAYLFIFAMPYLYYLSQQNKLSTTRFAKAELVYTFYLWLIFFLTYLPRVQGKLPNVGGTYQEHVILLGWVGTLLGFKISSFFAYKRTKS